MDEGKKSRKEKLGKDFKKYGRAWSAKGAATPPTQETYNEFMAKAEQDGFNGSVGLDKVNKKIVYKPASDSSWSTSGGHAFGSGV